MKGIVAALFVQRDGVYFGIESVDPWDAVRDARKYPGPHPAVAHPAVAHPAVAHPAVAHPPCQRWGNMEQATLFKETAQKGAGAVQLDRIVIRGPDGRIYSRRDKGQALSDL